MRPLQSNDDPAYPPTKNSLNLQIKNSWNENITTNKYWTILDVISDLGGIKSAF